ncbi:MAG: XrtA/PEP-CTERM system TPR-repeat protein PrsT [Pseudomonadota bacterium]
MTHRKLIAGLVGAGLALAATADANPRSQRFVEKARERLAANDPQAALIELRNAVQADDEDWDARRLLGNVYMALGRADIAVDELKLAYDNTPSDAVEIEYGRALASLQRFDEALEVITEEAQDGRTRRQKLLLRGEIKRLKGDSAGALSDANRVIEEDPLNTIANYLAASSYLAEGDLIKAQERLDLIVQNDLEFANAWLMKAQIASRSSDYAAAIEYAERALEIDPNNAVASITRIEGLMRTNRLEEAEAAIRKVEEKNPRDARVPFFRTLAAAQAGEFAEADRQLAQVGDAIENLPNGQLLTGLIKFKTGNFGQAEQALSAFRAKSPGSEEAGLLLAAVQMRRERYEAAHSTINEVLAANPKSAGAYQLRASVAMRQGDYDRAAAAMQVAATTGEQSSAGIVKMLGVGGDTDAEVLELDDVERQILTTIDYLRSNEDEKALRSAKRVADLAPENPVAQNLLASVHMARNELPQARAALEAALEQNPAFYAAILNLDRLDARNNDFDAIEARLRRARGELPNSAVLARRMGEFLYVRGREEEALRVLQDASSSVDDPYEVLQVKARIELARRDTEAAKETVRRISTLDHELAVPFAAAMSQRIGDNESAKRLFDDLVADDPTILAAGIGRARADIALGNAETAITDLRNLVERAPQVAAYRDTLARILASEGRTDEAIAVAKAYAEQNRAAGVVLEAGVREAAGDADAAIKTLEDAMAAKPDPAFARALLSTRIRKGDRKKALQEMQAWLQKNPRDAEGQIFYGTVLIEDGRLQDAERVLSAALAQRQNSAPLLNNLAWVRQETGRPGAEDLARRAYEIAPNSAEIADTLGWILYEDGEFEEGLRFLREAYEDAPDNATIAYHLAAAIAKTDGSKEEALQILDRALERNATFPERADAEALQAQLRS